MTTVLMHKQSWQRRVALGAMCVLLFLCQQSSAQQAQGFEINLKPVSGPGGAVEAIEVDSVLTAPSGPNGKPLSFAIPVDLFGNGKVADKISDVRLTDAHGDVPWQVKDDPADSAIEDKLRHWSATSPVQFPVKFHYRAAVMNQSARSNPPWGLKAADGGVAGSGLGFLVLPENATTTSTLLHWNLTGLPSASTGVITAGEGDVVLPGSPDALRYQWMLAGPATVYHQPGTEFSAFALGQPPYDLNDMLRRAGSAYVVLDNAFPYLKPGPGYRLLLRAFDYPSAHTGTAFTTGVLLSGGNTFEKGVDERSIRNVLLHEMTHRWVGLMAGQYTTWFNEGLTAYETTMLGYSSGLDSFDDYTRNLKEITTWYYASSARDWSQAKIETVGGLGHDDIRDVPYGRGALYFAELDTKIRTHSKGKHTLNSVLNSLFAERESGVVFDQAKWELMLTHELGPEAVMHFRQVIVEGTKEEVPSTMSFGPCLRRTAVSLLVIGTNTTTKGYEWRVPATNRLPSCHKEQRTP